MTGKRSLTIDVTGPDPGPVSSGFQAMGGAADRAFSGMQASAEVAFAALATGAAAATGAIALGFNEALDREQITDRMNAALGATGEVAERNARVASSVYAGAWGDSMGEVAGAIESVLNNVDPSYFAFEDGEAALENLTTRALDLGTVMDEDVGAIMQTVGQMLRNDLAGNATEAFDLIAAGQTNGLNRTQDLLDTVNEYSTSFARLGFDGNQALGLLNQGLDVGVFNTDKIGDAFNELSIRAIDGSKATTTAIESFGLNADAVAESIAMGGDNAATSTSILLMNLREMEDQVAQDAAGVALFGSMWEDLGSEAILALDPMTAGLENVEGASGRLGDELNDNLGVKLESLKRRGLQGLVTFAENWVVPAVEKVIDVFGTDGFAGVLALAQTQFAQAWPSIRSTLGDVADGIVDWVGDTVPVVADQLGELAAAFVDWVEPQIAPTLEKLGDWTVAGANWLIDVGLPTMVEKLASWAAAFVEWVVPMIPPLMAELGSLLIKIGGWVVTDAAPKLIGYLVEWSAQFVAWAATDLTPKLLSAAGTMFMDFGKWIVLDAAPMLASRLASWTTQFLGWVGELPGKLASIGGGMFDWIGDAFRSAMNWVIDKWNDLAVPEKTFGLGPLGSITIGGWGFPDIPRLHAGGTVIPPSGQQEGLYVLRRGEKVSTPGQASAATAASMGGVVAAYIAPKDVVEALIEYDRGTAPILPQLTGGAAA